MAYKNTIIPFLSEQQSNRFWSNVKILDNDCCWLWLRDKGHVGHGRTSFNDVAYSSHRVAYYLHYGIQPADLQVNHLCDNPPCCNPTHLYLGTQADNMLDKKLRNRAAKGDRHGLRLHPERTAKGIRNGAFTHPDKVRKGEQIAHLVKLSEQQVKEIRSKYVPRTYGLKRLAAEYNVTFTAIHSVVTRKTWKHIP